MTRFTRAVRVATLLGLAAMVPATAFAQYFGRNKVQFDSFDFEVLKTRHFDVYFYPEERQAAEVAATSAERWYDILSRQLHHTFTDRQPLILYASHPAFEQTNVLSGDIQEGTGGVTESFKRRIVLPLAGPLAETDHVIGHELTHAFQYDITGQGRSLGGWVNAGATRLPLWFIEGMAEYCSLGDVDPHTAMWIRDAAIAGKLPTIRQLDDPRWFPYRYGQALWAYIAGRYGEESVGRILRAAGRSRNAEDAIRSVLGMSPDTLSAAWHRSIRAWAEPITRTAMNADSLATVIVSSAQRSPGALNIAPALSPDGRKLVFLSERDLFSVEMYLADADSGRIVRRLTRTAVDPHYQSLEFINSAGSFSPDGRQFAFPAVVNARPVLTLLDASSGETLREIPFPSLGEIFTPTWSPDGRQVAFTALVGGLMDLYVVNIETRDLRRLTTSPDAELHPAWSPDGRWIAFATDRFAAERTKRVTGLYQLARIDVTTGGIERVQSYADGKNINPQWSADGRALYFLSDHEGITNVHRVDLATGRLEQITNLRTGVSGITDVSPALSVATSGRIAFSVYEKRGYSLYRMDAPRPLELAASLNPGRAAMLPHDQSTPLDTMRTDSLMMVAIARADSIRHAEREQVAIARADTVSMRPVRYHPHLSLDYVSQPALAIGASDRGVAVGGGATLYWSDMLGDHNLVTLFQANSSDGPLQASVAAIAAYQNLKHRWNWGVLAGQVPYVTHGYAIDDTVTSYGPATIESDYRDWEIDREVSGLLAYPLSRVQRVEFEAGLRRIDYISDVRRRIFDNLTGSLLVDETLDLNGGYDAITLGIASAALVYDTSIFGGTSPLLGRRYRIEGSTSVGSVTYFGALLDHRLYAMPVRPLTLAARVLHVGRYGGGAEDVRLPELYAGYSTLIHGYDAGSFSSNEPVYETLFGSKLAVGNIEARLPLLGSIGILRTPGVPPVEAALFYDAGVAWTSSDEPTFLGGDRRIVTSYGSALRVNLFGFAVGEAAYVHPNDREERSWRWQFSLQPGF